MSNAFNPETADFSGIIDKEGLYLSDAFHRAYVGVDENGTEAAAVIAAVFRPRSRESRRVAGTNVDGSMPDAGYPS